MTFGLVALGLAFVAAGWLLVGIARSAETGGGRGSALVKAVIWLGIAAALAAAKLWPLAFMVLVAAGGVALIESWRAKSAPAEENAPSRAPGRRAMTIEEARAVLGVGKNADASEIRAAYRKLITQLHPDKGGTDYLAAQINEARMLLLASAAPREDADR